MNQKDFHFFSDFFYQWQDAYFISKTHFVKDYDQQFIYEVLY